VTVLFATALVAAHLRWFGFVRPTLPTEEHSSLLPLALQAAIALVLIALSLGHLRKNERQREA
jgi:hypothetical protein